MLLVSFVIHTLRVSQTTQADVSVRGCASNVCYHCANHHRIAMKALALALSR
jgi:hypothetical protein